MLTEMSNFSFLKRTRNQMHCHEGNAIPAGSYVGYFFLYITMKVVDRQWLDKPFAMALDGNHNYYT